MSIFFIMGSYFATQPHITYYQIHINQSAKINHLKIVQLTDIHINAATSKKFLQNMVERVNQLEPDYIFITGDTLDQRLKPYLDKNLSQIFGQLKSTFGTFIIMGNHEHYGMMRDQNNRLDQIIDVFEQSKMKVLVDEVFYDPKTEVTIIGRDDYVNQNRQPLEQLIAQTDKTSPIILLEYQPRFLTQNAQASIDVMFSGHHTHAGQLFPITLLVNHLYVNSWGKYKIDSHFTSIVSSGYGLWGPPIRLMTRSEIVVADLYFKPQQKNK